jgi:deferrochelatase/peroxidase EfeB
MALQEGIYHARGQRPGAFFTILFLRAQSDRSGPEIADAVERLWTMYQKLKRGEVSDLPGRPVPPGDLTVLLGYGANVFQRPDRQRAAPADLARFGLFRSPEPSGGGPLLIGSGLRYAADVTTNPATEHFAVQLIGETALAVNRGVVETWKLLHDLTDAATGLAPLQLSAFYAGFRRDDQRSWIDFHDGISNMRSEERLDALAIKPTVAAADRWTEGGTYLTFLRVAVDLVAWRRLAQVDQERLVGREKLTGCPLIETRDGKNVAAAGCPFAGTRAITDPQNDAFREPPPVADAIIRRSHVQRANHHLGPPSAASSVRVFRQGYEFLESVAAAPGFRAGLNFVAFQDTPQRLFRMLTADGWLGTVNFGGDPTSQPPGADRLLTVRAGATFLVPPVSEGEPFPGAWILKSPPAPPPGPEGFAPRAARRRRTPARRPRPG